MGNSVQPSEQIGNGAAHAPRGAVPSVDAACRILGALAQSDGDGITLTALARELALSKSSAHGLLATLVAHGFVQRDEASRRYRLGAALVPLGRVASGQLRAAARVGERIVALAAEHGLTFAVAQVTDEGDAQVIDRAYPASDLHVGLMLGSRYGPFDGAIGKCLLAALDPEQAEAMIRRGAIPRHTDRTIVDPDALVRDVAKVRERGWAASEGEFKENYAVAAPLYDANDALELVIFAVGFAAQVRAVSVPVVGTVLRETADAIRVALGAAADRSATFTQSPQAPTKG